MPRKKKKATRRTRTRRRRTTTVEMLVGMVGAPDEISEERVPTLPSPTVPRPRRHVRRKRR